MPTKEGTKHVIDLNGDPYINLMFAVLAKSKKDFEDDYGKDHLIWAKFKEDYPGYLDMMNIDPWEKAEWVMDFIQKYGIRDHCLSVKDFEEKCEETRRVNKANANLGGRGN